MKTIYNKIKSNQDELINVFCINCGSRKSYYQSESGYNRAAYGVRRFCGECNANEISHQITWFNINLKKL
jgi:hypothetical protein